LMGSYQIVLIVSTRKLMTMTNQALNVL
jgi:hypothetical protein